MSARSFVLFLAAFLLALPIVFRPDDVPARWQPWGPLDLGAAPTPVTGWKLRRLAGEKGACLAVLVRQGAEAVRLPDRPLVDGCGIPGCVRLTDLGRARIPALVTRCEMAARLAGWERHTLQPAARRHFGTGVARALHYDSYACRAMRTARGSTGRMSQHATANAVDIAGFVLDDGRQVTLLRGWTAGGPEAAFLREAQGGLCQWFNMVLGPDYNRLHADHFHADMGAWPGCR